MCIPQACIRPFFSRPNSLNHHQVVIFWLTSENGNCSRRQTFRFIQSSYLCHCKIVHVLWCYGTLHAEHNHQAILCISHKVSNFLFILFIFSLSGYFFFVFLHKFNFGLHHFYMYFVVHSLLLLYCYRKFIFCFRFPWKYLAACGKNGVFFPLFSFFYPSFSPWATYLYGEKNEALRHWATCLA